MIFVDTGAWFALFVPWDTHHSRAHSWYDANSERLATTDFVLDETLTLFRQRGEDRRALAFGKLLLRGGLADIHRITEKMFLLAWETFQTYSDKKWSFTDCTSKIVIESLSVTTAFSFDQHFRQFGSVAVVPELP